MTESSNLMRHTIEALDRSQAVVELSLDGEVLRANPRFLKLMGYSELEIIGRRHSIFVMSGEDNSADYQALWNRLRRGKFTTGEFRRVTKAGEPVWIYGAYCPLLDDQGHPYRIVKFASDVTEKKRRDADFAGQIEAIRRSQAVAEFDLNGNVIDANRKFLEILGYRLDEIKGRHHSMFILPDQRDAVEYRAFWWRLRDGDYHAGLFKRIDSTGNIRWIQASYNPVRDENGKLAKVVKFATDQTAAVEDHVRVEYLYRHDTLTGLANRIGLQSAVDAALAGATDGGPTMLLIDLDKFKFINDTFGHPAGDFCLTVVAERIKSAAPFPVVVARLGGDEFAVVLDAHVDAEAVAVLIVKSVGEPFTWHGTTLQVGASVGIGRDGQTGSELLRRADIALYAAKNAGRNTYRVYARSLEPDHDLSRAYA
ncbi:PAS domain S-box protein [Rhodopseudomonas sp.]|uniref:PAS domain S-box protein n=1 Tax=Rhodopseudomonas sp. TaxID=1078 RepID=UPI0039E385CE